LNGPFDVIVSNPPYIPSFDIENLQEDVRAHDPRSALDGGVSGLDAYRVLAPCTMKLLKSGGITIFEVGIGQAEDVARLLNGAGLVVLEKRADISGVVRVVIARKS
jgi:release factor glutamine methyltransferase